MKFFWTIFLTLLIGNSAYGQDKRFLPFIRFHSEFEKQSWSRENIDYIDLHASIDSTIKKSEVDVFKKKIVDFYSTHAYSTSIKAGKKRIKELESLYLSIHNTFLERYREEVDFSDLIRKKEFNCVTASILYAHILAHYNIPYIILNEPNHVFLVAYPEEEYVVLQTTSPNFKDFQTTEKTRRAIVKSMLMNKSISQREIDTLGLDKVYEINWLGQNRVLESELIGYEYYNKVLHTVEESRDYLAAAQFALRTMYLIPKKKEFNQTFVEVGNFGLQETSGLDSTSLQLKLLTLDEVKFNDLNSKEMAQGLVMFWLIQRLKLVMKDSDFGTMSNLSSLFFGNSDYLYYEDEYDEYDEYEEDYEFDEDYDYEEELEEEIEEEQDEEEMFKSAIVKDLPAFEYLINEFVKNDDWNRHLNVFLYEVTVHLFMELEIPDASKYLEKLKKIDPKNKVVRVNESRILVEKYTNRVLDDPFSYSEIVSEFRLKASDIEMSKYRMNNLEMDVFNDFEEKCRELYRARKVKEANKYFNLCKDIYVNGKEYFSPSQLKSLEYELGFLYVFKSEKYSRSEKIRILKEGVDLLPKHKSLNATYKFKIRH